ncbi:MAG: hypothetical protein QXK88_05655 [Desulfurococcaceae archaeon]
MLYPSLDHKKLNLVVSELRNKGLWAERHSYSIRIMYAREFVASLHLYPGFNEAVLRLYGKPEANKLVLEAVESALGKHLPGLFVKLVFIKRFG